MDEEHRGFSPLTMVTKEPTLDAFIRRLDRLRAEIESARSTVHIEFKRSELQAVRDAFARAIRHGESRLHTLCELLVDSLLESEVALQSSVVGEVESTQRRFTISEDIDHATLYSQTDLQLGSRMLEQLSFETDSGRCNARLISNSVVYQPIVENRFQIHRMISRIKAEEEIWNKVCDELFQLDQLVERDKQLREMGRYVKDVFGLKIIVETPAAALDLHHHLSNLVWIPEQLEYRGAPVGEAWSKFQEVETKDYIGEAKTSGWSAVKSVYRWGDRIFEVQIQPINVWYRELLYLTRESHAGHKERREHLRAAVKVRFPLFAFYSHLLQWLFMLNREKPPEFRGVKVNIIEDMR